jgi:hypothetical protein
MLHTAQYYSCCVGERRETMGGEGGEEQRSLLRTGVDALQMFTKYSLPRRQDERIVSGDGGGHARTPFFGGMTPEAGGVARVGERVSRLGHQFAICGRTRGGVRWQLRSLAVIAILGR